MRSRPLLILIALVLAGVATFLVYQDRQNYRQQLNREFRSKVKGLEPVSVVVAAQDISKRGTVITEEMVKVEKVPERALQPYAAQDPMEVIGKEPLGPVAQGQQFLKNQLVVPGTAGGRLAMKIPPEKRAISMEINLLTAVSGFIRPGDRVDVLWTFAIGEPQQPVTLTLFQGVEVLAVGGLMRAGGEADDVKDANTLTLALSPQEAELLLFAGHQGRFQLSLRPRADEAQVALPPMTMDALLQHVLPQAQAAPPPPPKSVKHIEIIRGKEREVVALTPEGNVASSPAAPPSPPAASSQQPAASNQQSAISSQQPANPNAPAQPAKQ